MALFNDVRESYKVFLVRHDGGMFGTDIFPTARDIANMFFIGTLRAQTRIIFVHLTASSVID